MTNWWKCFSPLVTNDFFFFLHGSFVRLMIWWKMSVILRVGVKQSRRSSISGNYLDQNCLFSYPDKFVCKHRKFIRQKRLSQEKEETTYRAFYSPLFSAHQNFFVYCSIEKLWFTIFDFCVFCNRKLTYFFLIELKIFEKVFLFRFFYCSSKFDCTYHKPVLNRRSCSKTTDLMVRLQSCSKSRIQKISLKFYRYHWTFSSTIVISTLYYHHVLISGHTTRWGKD